MERMKGFIVRPILFYLLLVVVLFGSSSNGATCRDTNRSCSYWSSRKRCTTGNNQKYIQSTCPKSCGLCECKNQYSTAWCTNAKKAGYCRNHSDLMSRKCRSTCKMCWWGKWSKWSKCSRSCGKGVITRTRSCKGARRCSGEAVQRLNCIGTACQSRPRPSRPRPSKPKPSLGCGRINEPLKIKRIVGGKETSEYKWPWMVGVFSSPQSKFPFCGGTLITKNIVLTAAHCFPNPKKQVYVRVGDFDLSRTGSKEKIIRVKEVRNHPKYDERTMKNDLTVLVLQEPVRLSKEVNIVCIPNPKLVYKPRQSCFATGWGRTKEGGPRPTKLQEVLLPLANFNTCNRQYKGQLSAGNICAGYASGGKDSCQGDSGGPLVCQLQDGRYVLTGITSFGNGCARKGFFGVYTDLRKYINDKYMIVFNNP